VPTTLLLLVRSERVADVGHGVRNGARKRASRGACCASARQAAGGPCRFVVLTV
jgi:hypothetical protein